MATSDNDNGDADGLPSVGDPHGHAALLLVESLIHGLCENAAISTVEAIEITERAISVQEERAEAANVGEAALVWQSHAMLSSIAASLQTDIPGDSLPQQTN